ncbi:MAG: Dyp-type peroxidase [Bryobacteraceae bacterium]
MPAPAISADDIQGNSLAGFNKDHQTFVLVRMQDVTSARAWIRSLVPRVSPLSEVQKFNDVRRSMIARLGREPRSLAVTWMNVAVSGRAIDLLRREGDDPLSSDALRLGLAGGRSDLLNDPPDRSDWKFGGTEASSADVLVIVASDSGSHLRAVVRELRLGIKATKQKLLFVQEGHTLKGELRGHEHFGFRDGVSQPGVRGFTTEPKPGQPMIWPGQFLLGLPRQNDADPESSLPPLGCPEWAKNGSFVVLRRLQQDVEGFWQAMKDEAARIAAGPEFPGLDHVRLASMLVGRWPSGAPFVLSPAADKEALARSNDFTFGDSDKFPPVCPFAAHIRKVNPRGDPVEGGGPRSTLTRRFLRRGIPYTDSSTDRGLVFVSYQSSIENQFEFVSQQWANRDDLPVKPPGGVSGFDEIIGQNGNIDRSRTAVLFNSSGAAVEVNLRRDFVTPTGGGYFFSPSISTLRRWTE